MLTYKIFIKKSKHRKILVDWSKQSVVLASGDLEKGRRRRSTCHESIKMGLKRWKKANTRVLSTICLYNSRTVGIGKITDIYIHTYFFCWPFPGFEVIRSYKLLLGTFLALDGNPKTEIDLLIENDLVISLHYQNALKCRSLVIIYTITWWW